MAAAKIPLESITSSNLSAIGYDAEKRIAAVQFHNGHIYHYAGVSPETMLEWYGSASRGSYYGRQIRSKYQGQKMTGHCPDCGALGWVGDRCTDCGCSDVAEDPRKAPVGG